LTQCESEDFTVSFICTDPKGTILQEVGTLLQKRGYRIKVINTIDFKKSMRYNPFSYIKSEKDILKLVTALIENTKGDGKAGDEFWTKAEKLLY
jgi:type IV secretion system protein VirD4